MGIGALVLAATTGCGEEATVGERSGPEPVLPTLGSPSAPPSVPTDTFRKVRVVGSVVAAEATGCVDLEDTNGVLWTLLGPEVAGLAVGDRVTATGLPRPESPDCAGAPLVVQRLRSTP